MNSRDEQHQQLPADAAFLTTQDVQQLAGITRRNLDRYIESGIVTPFRSSASSNAARLFTFEQAKLVSRVKTLQHGNLTLPEIGQLAAQANCEMSNAVYSQFAQDIREARRGLKDAVSHQRLLADVEACGSPQGFYLRYIPQRWFAIMPDKLQGEALHGTQIYLEQALDLYTISNVVGWCSSDDVGTLTSVGAHGSATVYLCHGLASPAMPEAFGGEVVDGGCYRAFDTVGRLKCKGEHCTECARYGAEVESLDVSRWKQIEREHPHVLDQAICIDSLEVPYASGMWSDYTKKKLIERGAWSWGSPEDWGSNETACTEERTLPNDYYADSNQARPHQKQGWSVRPRIMPQKTLLPLGATACVLPAHVYLCLQCDLEHQAQATQKFSALLDTLQRKPLTLEDELRKFMLTREVELEPNTDGPFMEASIQQRHPGNPQMIGWFKALGEDELNKLVLPTNMGLRDEQDYCMLNTSLPSRKGDFAPRFELAVPIDANGVVADLPAELR